MSKFIYISILLFLIVHSSCNEINNNNLETSNVSIDDSLRQIISYDAFYLTHKLILDDTNYMDIELPLKSYNDIFNSLLLLYTANDSILNSFIYKTHFTQCPAPNKLALYLYVKTDWADRWYQDKFITLTNDYELNNLLTQINASLDLIWTLLDGYYIQIIFPDFWNLYALKQKFNDIQSISIADLVTCVDRSDILYNIEIDYSEENILFTFTEQTGFNPLGLEPFYNKYNVFTSLKTNEYKILNY